MKSDVKVKMFYGSSAEKHKAIEEFRKANRVIRIIPGMVTIVKYSLGQATMDDVIEVTDNDIPW